MVFECFIKLQASKRASFNSLLHFFLSKRDFIGIMSPGKQRPCQPPLRVGPHKSSTKVPCRKIHFDNLVQLHVSKLYNQRTQWAGEVLHKRNPVIYPYWKSAAAGVFYILAERDRVGATANPVMTSTDLSHHRFVGAPEQRRKALLNWRPIHIIIYGDWGSIVIKNLPKMDDLQSCNTWQPWVYVPHCETEGGLRNVWPRKRGRTGFRRSKLSIQANNDTNLTRSGGDVFHFRRKTGKIYFSFRYRFCKI